MLLAHRIRLDPNNMEANGFARAAGVAPFAYNWAIGEWQRQYALCKTNPALPKPSEAALRRQLNAIKRSSFPWMLEVTKNAPADGDQQSRTRFRKLLRRSRSLSNVSIGLDQT
jgi:putative transposase